ncbi:hypothetical protein ACQZV8_08655 [Magnetococcales bacterium HHB-1]
MASLKKYKKKVKGRSYKKRAKQSKQKLKKTIKDEKKSKGFWKDVCILKRAQYCTFNSMYFMLYKHDSEELKKPVWRIYKTHGGDVSGDNLFIGVDKGSTNPPEEEERIRNSTCDSSGHEKACLPKDTFECQKKQNKRFAKWLKKGMIDLFIVDDKDFGFRDKNRFMLTENKKNTDIYIGEGKKCTGKKKRNAGLIQVNKVLKNINTANDARSASIGNPKGFILLMHHPIPKTVTEEEDQKKEKKKNIFWHSIVNGAKKSADFSRNNSNYKTTRDNWRKILNRLVLITKIDDLRISGAQIRDNLSIESTVNDVYKALDKQFKDLFRCRIVIVHAAPHGLICFHRARGSKKFSAKVVYNPKTFLLEKCRQENKEEGRMMGYGGLLAATLTKAFKIENYDIDRVIKKTLEGALIEGMEYSRILFREGYPVKLKEEPEEKENSIKYKKMFKNVFNVSYPVEKKSDSDGKPPFPFTCLNLEHAQLKAEKKEKENAWSVLKRIKKDLKDKNEDPIDPIEIALKGEKYLHQKKIPFGRFNNLTTVDREEIEELNILRSLISNYLVGHSSTPLAIAVFGPPGAGKSFSVIQIGQMVGMEKEQFQTFNLSQFSSEKDLFVALQQVRNISITGKVPLVFWDEFDSSFGEKRLGWLKYFLQATQDGEFVENGITYGIGRSIFVFAGGTSERFDDFADQIKTDPTFFKNVKGPDFISRLKGKLDIKGINIDSSEEKDVSKKTFTETLALQSSDGKSRSKLLKINLEENIKKSKEDTKRTDASQDKMSELQLCIRRALLLRGLAKTNAKHLFKDKKKGDGELNIDSNVVRALLDPEVRYRHGVRSMEAIFAMSNLNDHDYFSAAQLPDIRQLELHMEEGCAEKFLASLS